MLQENFLNLRQALESIAHDQPNASAIEGSLYDPFTYSSLSMQIQEVESILEEFQCNTITKHKINTSGPLDVNCVGKVENECGLNYIVKANLGLRVGICIKEPACAVVVGVSVACFATAIPLNPDLTVPEFKRQLCLLDLDLLICMHGDNNEVLWEAAASCGAAVFEATPKSPRMLSFNLQLKLFPTTDRSPIKCRENFAFIIQTSGTTSLPKLVPYTHKNILAAADRVRSWYELDESDRCLSITPWYYCHGLTLTVMAPLLSGGTVVFPKSSKTIDVIEYFQTLTPTWYSAAPTMHMAIVDTLNQMTNPISNTLRFIVSGGAPLPEKTRKSLIASQGCPVLEHYGASEACQITSNKTILELQKSGTVGIPLEGSVSLLGDNDSKVRCGERGEILVRGPSVITGYLNDTELESQSFRGGWFHTGDIGSFDTDGFLTIYGRKKEVINRGGEKISPAEIENALANHHEVKEVCAFSIPHPRLGEDCAIAVVLHTGKVVSPQDLRQFMSRDIGWHKVPRSIYFLKEIPKNQAGKAMRTELSNQFAKPTA